jgi:hypothetical protein
MMDLEKFQRVNECESLEELACVIENFADERGIIEGRTKSFSAKSMASYCRKYSFPLHNTLTREFGIRQQAMYLLFYNK